MSRARRSGRRQRPLRDAVAQLDAESMEALLRAVPCLAEAMAGHGPLAPSWPVGASGRPLDHRGIERLLASPRTVEVLVASLDAPALALAQVAAWHGGAISAAQARREAAALDDTALAALARQLHDRLLTVPGDAWVQLHPAAVEQIDLPGFPAEWGYLHVRSEELAAILRQLRRPVPPRRAERIEALLAALRDPDVVSGAVERLPADAARAFALLAGHGPQRIADLGIPHWPPYGRRTDDAVTELLRHGFVGVEYDEQECFLWLDVLVGLRDGRLFGDAFPRPRSDEPVALAGGTVTLPPVLEQFDALLEHWRARPAPALAAGGLGVRPVRAAAKALGMTGPQVGFLASLATEIGLLGVVQTGATGRGRNRKVTYQWAPTPLLDVWRDTPPSRQWAQLVATWRHSPRLAERDGLPERIEPGDGYDTSALVVRSAWLLALTGLPDGHGIAVDDLVDVVRHRFPMLCSVRGVEALLAASRTLGLVAPSGPVGLTVAGRAVLAGVDALEAALPPPSTEVVVQADATVMVPPDAAPELTGTVARWAELESSAGARIYRITERRLATAFAGGADPDAMLDWFKAHSRVGLPQNVEYLIRDVARRRGQIRAGTATSYLRCDDPALLTRAVGVRAAKLRLLAPTVGVSPLSRDALLGALADAGVAAVAEDASGAELAPTTPEAERVGFHHTGAGLPALPRVPPLDQLAARLAEVTRGRGPVAEADGQLRLADADAELDDVGAAADVDGHVDDAVDVDIDDVIARLMAVQRELDEAADE